jgi:hypothetical protein
MPSWNARDGILQLTLPSNGNELEWGGGPHEDLSYLFADIARGFENKVIILTGIGESWPRRVSSRGIPSVPIPLTTSDGKRLRWLRLKAGPRQRMRQSA